jgi:hypothetical protein
MVEADILARLETDGFIRRETDGARTTPRWQAAMARAALRLYGSDAPWQDLRLPIASALLEIYGALSDAEIARYVEAILPIEEVELRPLNRPARLDRRTSRS